MKLFHKKNESEQPTEAQKAGSARVLKNGAYAAVLTAIVLVAVILINLVIRALPTKYTEYDISTAGLFTLSDTTLNLLHSLDTDVTAYYLGENGNEDTNITRMLDRYAGETSHFKWEQRDPVLYPTFAQQYGAQDATTSSIILVCGDKSVVLDHNTDLYEYDMSDYYTTGTYDLRFAAESALTSGISRVTSDASYVLYQLTGHGESELSTDFTDTLDNSGVSVESLNLLSTGSIPEDASVLLINAPQVDYTSDTIDLLREYLDNGGALVVTTALTYDTPNLDALLAEYGMTRQSGLLVENDADHYAAYYGPAYLLPDMSVNDITSGVTDGMMTFAPVSQGIVTDDDTEDITYTTLLSTSSNAFAMQDYETATDLTQSDSDPTGSFKIAVAAEDSATGARIVWCGCPNMFLSATDQSVSGGNSQLFGSIVNWMAGAENSAVVDSKSLSAEYLTVPSIAVIGFGLLAVIILPVACIVFGVVVFILRRRR